jgi:hypothetical protein
MGGKGSEASGTRIEVKAGVKGAIDMAHSVNHATVEENPTRGV